MNLSAAPPSAGSRAEDGRSRRGLRRAAWTPVRRLLGAVAVSLAVVNVRFASGASYGDLAGPGFRGLVAELLIGYALVFWLRAAPTAAARTERALRLCYRPRRPGLTSRASQVGHGNPS